MPSVSRYCPSDRTKEQIWQFSTSNRGEEPALRLGCFKLSTQLRASGARTSLPHTLSGSRERKFWLYTFGRKPGGTRADHEVGGEYISSNDNRTRALPGPITQTLYPPPVHVYLQQQQQQQQQMNINPPTTGTTQQRKRLEIVRILK